MKHNPLISRINSMKFCEGAFHLKIVSETQYGDVIIESDTMLMSEVKGSVTVLSGAKLNLIF